MARLGALVAVVFSLLCASVPAQAQEFLPAPFAAFQHALVSTATRAPGRVALAVEDLSTGYRSAYNGNASMPAASTIKVPIMVEVFHQLQAGSFDLNRRVTLTSADRDWGSGSLASYPLGSEIPVSTLLAQMITVSDNTAANMLIRLVGRSNINATMKGLGLEHTHLTDSIHTQGWGVRNTLRTSANDMVRLLVKMAQDKLIDEWSSKQMVAIMEAQEINTLLPEPLPDVPIAHKTGSFNDTLNDVGIVYAGSSPYVIAVMTTNLPSLSSGRTFIRHVSKLAYSSLHNFAKWREANGFDKPLAEPAQANTTTTAPADDDGSQQDVPMWGTPTPAPSPSP